MHRQNATYIIAEAGVNHNGSLDYAMGLIDAAAKAGANAVKFQTFQADSIVSTWAPKADYQRRTTGTVESQFQMLRRLELDEEAHRLLRTRCDELGIDFLSTPFDTKSVQFLKTLGVPRLKIASGEITNGPLLLEASRTGKPIVLSTGMSTLTEVRYALSILAFGYLRADLPANRENFDAAFRSLKGQKALRDNVVLLHCTTEYPAPFNEINLRSMDTLYDVFRLPVGLSDHSVGVDIALAAVARGARVIEKHFTLDRSLPGPDHTASLLPNELESMVLAIRNVELALGTASKEPSASEVGNLRVVRRSLTAARPIAQGERFTEENLTLKRPGTGICASEYWDWLGRKASRDFQPDELITP